MIALPWSSHERPSGALGALAGFLRRDAPDLSVDVYYEYLTVAQRLGPQIYGDICKNSYIMGELLYCPHLYAESLDRVLPKCLEFWLMMGGRVNETVTIKTFEGAKIYVQQMILDLGEHLDSFVEQVAGRYDLVGLTTVFGQLFANLSFAKRLKAKSPETRIILGGSTLSAHVGPSIINEYDFIDYIIQGEGEGPLLGLIRGLQGGGDVPAMGGVLSRGEGPGARPAKLSELPSMNELPTPDFDEFAAVAGRMGIDWMLPVEGSRGCWWDRSTRTGNAKKTCYFCNLNVQWTGYREKTEARIVSEVEEQSRRYGRSRLFFLDNVIRINGIEKLASGIRQLGRNLNFFYEARANLKPREILALWEAGMDRVQFGIEGLSTAYLRRIGKGTTTMQNLQAMKVCAELEILNGANLLTEFPGATDDEVEETRRVIQTYAHAYQPLQLAGFWLGMGSTVDALKNDFPITNLRNHDFYALGVPERVYREVRFFDLSFDPVGTPASWDAVYKATAWWAQLWEACRAERRFPLSYAVAGDDIVVTRTAPRRETFRLRGLEADLFMFCQEMRTRAEIELSFTGRAAARTLDDLLGGWQQSAIAYTEAGRHLVLPCAESPALAQSRIRRFASVKAALPSAATALMVAPV